MVPDPKILLEIEKKINELESLLNSNNFNEIEDCTSRLKKIFNQIEAEELRKTAFRLELSARRGSYEDMIKYAKQMINEYRTYEKSMSNT